MELQVVLLLVHIVGFTLGLREVRIQVPLAVKKGDSATLNCWYDTEGDPLYIVKWYKARREFYRFVPKENPVIKTFPIGSLRVDKAKSNATQVTLVDLDSDATGTYSCEVSADAPSFHTVIVSGIIDVVELPTQTPTVSGMHTRYKVGDSVKVTCTSGRSKPAANLTWFINDTPPLDAQVRPLSPLDTNESEWQVAQIGLQFLVTEDHFKNGKLKIRCSASIYTIYWQSSEVSAEEDRPKVHLAPAATVAKYGVYQPPPNHQTGQKKPDGQVDVKIFGSSAIRLESSLQLILGWLMCSRFVSD